MNFRICAVSIIGKCWNNIEHEKHDSFNLWAVGLSSFLICEFIPRWNKLHGDVFFIYEDRTVDECVDNIIKFWRAQ